MSKYPVYRKLKNNKAFYKINSKNHFEEIQLVGSKKNYFIHEAKQYPEKLKIMDMLDGFNGLYPSSTEEEWISLKD